MKEWTDHEDFLAQLGRRSGKLLKGGDPDLITVARMVLQDWQRGRVPYFTLPPDYTVDPPSKGKPGSTGEKPKSQDSASVDAMVTRAQDAIVDISVQVAEEIGDALPQKRGYFMPEDATEAGDAQLDEIDVDSQHESGDNNQDSDLSGHDDDYPQVAIKTGDAAAAEEVTGCESDSESDGYGADGLSWEAVMKSMAEIEDPEAEDVEELDDEELPAAKHLKKN